MDKLKQEIFYHEDSLTANLLAHQFLITAGDNIVVVHQSHYYDRISEKHVTIVLYYA